METQELQAYDDWVAEYMEELVDQHESRVVAVFQSRVVAVGDSECEVYSLARQAGVRQMPLVLRVPTERETYFL